MSSMGRQRGGPTTDGWGRETLAHILGGGSMRIIVDVGPCLACVPMGFSIR